MPPVGFDRAGRDAPKALPHRGRGSTKCIASVILEGQPQEFPPLGRGAETALA
jgi:hypothetical protein